MAQALNPFNNSFNCYFENEASLPLIISPGSSEVDFVEWAEDHQEKIAQVIKEYGAVVFSGFGLTEERFNEAFTAVTGMPPQSYKGDTPRDEVDSNIYKSTAVAKGATIPLHQEVSGGARTDMPKYISFFCVTPPKSGTGQTLVGSARDVSDTIRNAMPAVWQNLSTKTLTYTARYLPKDSWRTRWIRWLNPSHATIEKRFGTENRREVEEKCRQEGLTCSWDGEWAVVSRSGVPATIEVDGITLFCNQIHVDKLNPKLCGGWFKYLMARLLLYPTSGSMQFDVQFDDGTQINRSDASTLLTILEQHQTGRDWIEGDLMVLDNATTMHGKTRHEGNREILVAMSGSIKV